MKNKLVIGAFLLMVASFIVVLALPADEESIKAENRAMATIPPFTGETVFSGGFASGFESFIGDNIGYRSFFTDVSKNMENSRGFVPDTGKIVAANKDIGTGTTQKQTLLVVDNTIMEMFIRNPIMERMYTNAVNHYADKLPEGIKLYNMIIPTQLEFQEPIYKNIQDSQKDTIESICFGLNDNVTAVDAYSELEKHKDEYIYFRTDHHWTQLGAYYAYRAFMEEAGGEAVNKDDYEKNKISGFLGYLYKNVDSAEIAAAPDSIEWFDIDAEPHITTSMRARDDAGEEFRYSGTMYDRRKTTYDFFFSSDHPLIEMTNENNPDGKTLVILKESYSNVLAPWLIESYHKVVLVDPRIYEGDFEDVIEEYSPDEVLITNYIFTTNFEDYCELLTDLY